MAHSYWRVMVVRNNGSGWNAISRLQFRATLGGTDQATGGTPIASHTHASYPASQAFDNNTSTVAASDQGLPWWLGYQFPSPVDVAQLLVSSGPFTGETPRTFTLQGSDDGIVWKSYAAFEGATGWSAGESRTFDVPAVSSDTPGSTFLDDFSGESVGAWPTGGWAARSEWDGAVVADAARVGGKYVTVSASAPGDAVVPVNWALAEHKGVYGDLDLSTLTRFPGGASAAGAVVVFVARRSGDFLYDGYYLWFAQHGSSGIQLHRVSGGVDSLVFEAGAEGGTGDDPKEIRIVREGARVRVWIWVAGGSQPVDPFLDWTDTSPLTDGYVGFGRRGVIFNGTGPAEFDYFGTTVLANAAPVVEITSPLDAATYTQGQTVELRGTATDTEDGDLTASIAWSSDLDGALGTGGSVDVTTLSIGTHVLTASVADSEAQPGSDSVTITIQAAPKPDTPTLSVLANAGTALLTGSAYSHPQGKAHVATEFDLDGTIVHYDEPVTQHTESGLEPGTTYSGRRVRYLAEE
jgi:hypothetical protein